MKVMKKLILFLVVLLFVGCKTTVKSVKQKEQLLTETRVDKSEVAKEKSSIADNSTLLTENNIKKTIDEIERAIEDLEARLVLYDTDKPIDEKTGKPPAKSELIITKKKLTEYIGNRKETNSNIAESKSDIKITQAINKTITSDSLTNIQEKTKSLTTDKTISNKSWILFSVIGVSLALLLFLSKTSIFKVLKNILFSLFK